MSTAALIETLRFNSFIYLRIASSTCKLFLVLAALFFLLPVLNGIFPNPNVAGEVQFLQSTLGVINIINYALFLLNIVTTSYTPFGRSVSSKNAFMTAATGYPTEFVTCIFALVLVYSDRRAAEQVVTFEVQTTQNATLNLTAYRLGLDEIFVDTVFEDTLGALLRENIYNARLVLILVSLLFAAISYILARYGTADLALDAEYEDQFERGKWRIPRYSDKKRRWRALLGGGPLPLKTRLRIGPGLRNGIVAVSVPIITIIYLFQLTGAEQDSLDEGAQLAAILIVACLLTALTAIKALRNMVVLKYAEVTLFEMLLSLQYVLTLALRDPFTDYVRSLSYGYLGALLAVYFLSFGERLPQMLVETFKDMSKFVALNYFSIKTGDPVNKVFRLLFPIAIASGLMSVFFAIYSINGNMLEIDFSNGNAVENVQGVVENIQSEMNAAVERANDFLVAITPCSRTEYIYEVTPTLVKEQNADQTTRNTINPPSAAQILGSVRSRSPGCFTNPTTGTWVLLGGQPLDECRDDYFNWRDADLNQSAFSSPSFQTSINTAFKAVDGMVVDEDFTDEDGLPETLYEVLVIDPECEAILCQVFTITTLALFAASLFPFVGTAASIASKVTNVAFKIARIGRKLLRSLRKVYAKRKKLTRLIQLIKKLNAIGSPIIKFSIGSVFLYIPTGLVAVFCILLGFFQRDIRENGKRSLLEARSVQIQLFVLFMAFGITNVAIYLVFFYNDYLLEFARDTLNNLPEALIRSTVVYGAGARYLRYSLIFSMVSSFFFAATLSVDVAVGLALNGREVLRMARRDTARLLGGRKKQKRKNTKNTKNTKNAKTVEKLEITARRHYFSPIRAADDSDSDSEDESSSEDDDDDDDLDRDRDLDRDMTSTDYESGAESQSESESAPIGAQKKDKKKDKKKMEYADLSLENSVASTVVALAIVLPVVYFAFQAFNNPVYRLLVISGGPDERLTEVSENILNSELIEGEVGQANSDFDDQDDAGERNCGLIGVAVEAVFGPLLDQVKGALRPFYASLGDLRTTARTLISNVKENIYEPFDLNLPYGIFEWLVTLSLPVLYVFLAAGYVVMTALYTAGNNSVCKCRWLVLVLNQMDIILLSVSLMGLQFNLVIYFLLSSITTVDFPLFNVQTEIGLAIIYGILCSGLCMTSAMSLYINRLVPLV